MAKQTFGIGDFDHISQRVTRATALLEVISAAAQHHGQWEIAEALGFVATELSDIGDCADEARKTIEAQAVQQ